MGVDCGSGFAGNIANEEKATSIVVTVFDSATGRKREVALNNPPEGIRSYYGGLDSNSWVTRQLGDKGILVNSNTKLDLTSAKFPDTLTLYSDTNKQGAINKGSAGGDSSAFEYSCFYTGKPSIITSQSCGGKICSGDVKCWDRGGKFIGQTSAACKAANNGGCLSASACASDKTTDSADPGQVAKDGFEDSLRRRGAQ